jgi:hypothetical protein
MFGYDEEEYRREVIAEAAGYTTKDSGEKTVHSDGVQRDTQKGKRLFTLMFPKGVPLAQQLIVRVADLYTRGAEKYGDRNWEGSKGEDTLAHHEEALWRHFMNFYFDVQDGEDHAAAIVWNINAVELTRRNLKGSEPAVEQQEAYDPNAPGKPRPQMCDQLHSTRCPSGSCGVSCQMTGYRRLWDSTTRWRSSGRPRNGSKPAPTSKRRQRWIRWGM